MMEDVKDISGKKLCRVDAENQIIEIRKGKQKLLIHLAPVVWLEFFAESIYSTVIQDSPRHFIFDSKYYWNALN